MSSPVLTGLNQRLNQTSQKLESRESVIGSYGFLIQLDSTWKTPLFLILYYAYVLFQELRNTAPITRGSVLLISVAVALIFINISSITPHSIWKMHSESIRRLAAVIGRQQDLIGDLGECIGTTTESIKTLRESIDLRERLIAERTKQAEASKGIRGKLRGAIKALRSRLSGRSAPPSS